MSYEHEEIFTFDWKTNRKEPEKLREIAERYGEPIETDTGDLVFPDLDMAIFTAKIPDNLHGSVAVLVIGRESWRERGIISELRTNYESPVKNGRRVNSLPTWTVENYMRESLPRRLR